MLKVQHLIYIWGDNNNLQETRLTECRYQRRQTQPKWNR